MPDITLVRGATDEALNTTNGRLPDDWYLEVPPKLQDTSAKSLRLAQDALRYLSLQCREKSCPRVSVTSEAAFSEERDGDTGRKS